MHALTRFLKNCRFRPLLITESTFTKKGYGTSSQTSITPQPHTSRCCGGGTFDVGQQVVDNMSLTGSHECLAETWKQAIISLLEQLQ